MDSARNFQRKYLYRRVCWLQLTVVKWLAREKESRDFYNSLKHMKLELKYAAIRGTKKYRKEYEYELKSASEEMAKLLFGEGYLE